MSLITRMRRQYAVLWKSNGKDKFGQPKFIEPVEIKCRWEDRVTTFIDPEGKETNSQAVVYVDRDVAPDADFLWEGRLADVPSQDPADVDTFLANGSRRPWPVRGYARLPDIRAKETLRTAYL